MGNAPYWGVQNVEYDIWDTSLFRCDLDDSNEGGLTSCAFMVEHCKSFFFVLFNDLNVLTC